MSRFGWKVLTAVGLVQLALWALFFATAEASSRRHHETAPGTGVHIEGWHIQPPWVPHRHGEF